MSYVNQKIKHGLSALMGRPGGLDRPFSTDKPASKDMPEALKPKEPMKTTLPEMKWAKLDGSSIKSATKSFEDFTAAAEKLEGAFHESSLSEKTDMVERERKSHTLLTADLMKAKRDMTREALDAHLGIGTFARAAGGGGGTLTKETIKELEAEWGKSVMPSGSAITAGSISAAKIDDSAIRGWDVNGNTKISHQARVISMKETEGELFWKAGGQLVYILADGTEIPVKMAELPPSPEERLAEQLDDLKMDANEAAEAFGGW